VCILGIRTQSTARDQRDIWANFRGGHTINFQYFDSVKIILLRDRRRFGGSLDKFGALAMAGVSGPDSGGLKSRRESLADCPPCQSIRKTVRRSVVDAAGKVKACQT